MRHDRNEYQLHNRAFSPETIDLTAARRAVSNARKAKRAIRVRRLASTLLMVAAFASTGISAAAVLL